MKGARRELLKRAIAKYGRENQIAKAMEEIGELLTAVGRYEARESLAREALPDMLVYNIVDEIADARIMIDQLAIIYGVEMRCEEREGHKLARLEGRLAEEDPRAEQPVSFLPSASFLLSVFPSLFRCPGFRAAFFILFCPVLSYF